MEGGMDMWRKGKGFMGGRWIATGIQPQQREGPYQLDKERLEEGMESVGHSLMSHGRGNLARWEKIRESG